MSLAFVCAAKRIPLQIVTSEASSKEKRDHMTALGARLTLVASPNGETTKALTLEMIETVRRLAAAPGSYWTDQLNNTDQLPSYERMGEEIWEQTNGKVDAFVDLGLDFGPHVGWQALTEIQNYPDGITTTLRVRWSQNAPVPPEHHAELVHLLG